MKFLKGWLFPSLQLGILIAFAFVLPGTLHSQELLNIDFAGAPHTVKVGYAATGQSTNDYWNNYVGPYANAAALPNLIYADGTVSGSGLTVLNGPGDWGDDLSDPMYSHYTYNQDGNITVTVTNILAATNDIYIYGHGPSDNGNGVFTLSVDGTNYGTEATVNGPGWDSSIWQEGIQYVVFRGVQITNSAQVLTVVVSAGASGYSIINGMQIAPAVPLAPGILTEPASASIDPGASVSLSVYAIGTSPLSYQWLLGGAPLPGATSSALNLPNAQPTNAGIYTVVVTNAYGSITSSNATLTVNTFPPTITTQPQAGTTIGAGANVSLSVVAAGTAPLSYQWLLGSIPLPGATSSTFNLANAQPANAGIYTVVVTNAYGSITSSNATLTVNTFPPTITTQPQAGTTVNTSANVSLSVVAAGTAPLSYQWLLGSTPLPGATGSVFSVADAQPTNAGIYSVVITNAYGSITSSNAVLTVLTEAHPLINIDFAGAPHTVEVGYAATGQSTNDYWNNYVGPYANAAALPNLIYADGTVSGSGLTVLNGPGDWGDDLPDPMYSHYTYNQGGNITVTVTNLQTAAYDIYIYGHAAADNANSVFTLSVGGTNYGTQATINGPGWDSTNWQEGVQYVLFPGVQITNSAQVLTVLVTPGISGYSLINGMQIFPENPAAAITTQPTNQTVSAGGNASFSVVASGSNPLYYQWQLGSTNLPGATGSVLSLTNVQPANAGIYTVVVTNAYNSVASSNATLTVNPDPSLVQAVGLTASSGLMVVPINLVAQGNENALEFSVNFDPTLFSFNSVALGDGVSDGSILSNTNQIGSGRLGLLISLPAGASFAAGTQELAEVSFFASPVTNTTVSSISFGDSPTVRQVSSAQPSILPATYTSGSITLPPLGVEGDVFPLPNGDGLVTTVDWVQEGRFVAGLDTITNADEFQRADCAPRATQGDGLITVADWVQVGRYAAGLDSLVAAGESSSPGLTPLAGSGAGSGPGLLSLGRTLTVRSASARGGQNCPLSVQLQSDGDESGVEFSLQFDPTALSFVSASTGSGATGASLYVNTNKAGIGQLGIVLALPAGSTFSASALEVVKLNFAVAPFAAGSSAVTFGSTPLLQQVVSATAATLPTTYVSGMLAITPQNGDPVLTATTGSGSLTLSWPAWAVGFALESSSNLISPNWTGVSPAIVTNGANVNVTIPLSSSGPQIFYRLRHP